MVFKFSLLIITIFVESSESVSFRRFANGCPSATGQCINTENFPSAAIRCCKNSNYPEFCRSTNDDETCLGSTSSSSVAESKCNGLVAGRPQDLPLYGLCTLQELKDVCCGGECYDNLLTWTSEYCNHFEAVDGCSSKQGNQGSSCTYKTSAKRVRCCRGSSSVQCVSRDRNGNCLGNKNFDDAYDFCNDLDKDGHTDWRLCTKTELNSGVCCSTGCNYDRYQVWSVTDCVSDIMLPVPPNIPQQKRKYYYNYLNFNNFNINIIFIMVLIFIPLCMFCFTYMFCRNNGVQYMKTKIIDDESDDSENTNGSNSENEIFVN